MIKDSKSLKIKGRVTWNNNDFDVERKTRFRLIFFFFFPFRLERNASDAFCQMIKLLECFFMKHLNLFFSYKNIKKVFEFQTLLLF